MTESKFKLLRPPIVEAVIDLECDMPPSFKLTSVEQKAHKVFDDTYPKSRVHFIEEHRIQSTQDKASTHSLKREAQGLQFLTEEENQIVQVRTNGFSFNRLAPYSTLDEYLEEIKRTWQLFISIAAPVRVRFVRLRYINRIIIPLDSGSLELEDYFQVSPRLPDTNKLVFTSFVNQHTAVEVDTKYQVNIVLASQLMEDKIFPVILDICVAANEGAEVSDWAWIESKIQALRSLKNRIFENTLTAKCLSLFQT
jgi:uncharacterized protein (TIGR04255 family)